MRLTIAFATAGAILLAGSAYAYNIKHGYPAGGNVTEYHGICASGDRMMVVEHPDGTYSYEGPTGSGNLKKASLDTAAKVACGE